MIVDVLTPAGASPSSVAITFEVLSTANRVLRGRGREPAFAVRATGDAADAAIVFAGGLEPAPRGPAGLVIVPGLALASEAAVNEGLARPELVTACRMLTESAGSAEIAASCSGVFLVARAGLLEGRRATTSWWLAPAFRRMFPGVRLDTAPLVVRDGTVTTAGAAMAQLDLMLALVARHAGSDIAADCARYLVVDERRSQLPYMAISLLAASDVHVAQAEGWARSRLHEGIRVEDLSAAVGMAPRTFARRVEGATGLSPVRFLQRLRIERALELMATTRASLEAVSHQVGYAEPSTLRRLLRAEGVALPRRPPPGRGDPSLAAASRRVRVGRG